LEKRKFLVRDTNLHPMSTFFEAVADWNTLSSTRTLESRIKDLTEEVIAAHILRALRILRQVDRLSENTSCSRFLHSFSSPSLDSADRTQRGNKLELTERQALVDFPVDFLEDIPEDNLEITTEMDIMEAVMDTKVTRKLRRMELDILNRTWDTDMLSRTLVFNPDFGAELEEVACLGIFLAETETLDTELLQ